MIVGAIDRPVRFASASAVAPAGPGSLGPRGCAGVVPQRTGLLRRRIPFSLLGVKPCGTKSFVRAAAAPRQ
jgi:hypothetical protein